MPLHSLSRRLVLALFHRALLGALTRSGEQIIQRAQ